MLYRCWSLLAISIVWPEPQTTNSPSTFTLLARNLFNMNCAHRSDTVQYGIDGMSIRSMHYAERQRINGQEEVRAHAMCAFKRMWDFQRHLHEEKRRPQIHSVHPRRYFRLDRYGIFWLFNSTIMLNSIKSKKYVHCFNDAIVWCRARHQPATVALDQPFLLLFTHSAVIAVWPHRVTKFILIEFTWRKCMMFCDPI